MRVIFGNHRAQDGRSCEYEATFERQGDDVKWIARVTCNGDYLGRPSGTIRYAGPLSNETLEDQVRQLVKASISDRIGTA